MSHKLRIISGIKDKENGKIFLTFIDRDYSYNVDTDDIFWKSVTDEIIRCRDEVLRMMSTKLFNAGDNELEFNTSIKIEDSNNIIIHKERLRFITTMDEIMLLNQLAELRSKLRETIKLKLCS